MSTKTEVKKVVATVKKVRKPRKTTARKRPSKKFINKMVAFRGFMTGSEKTQITTLSVRNTLQRINNIAMEEDVNETFSGAENAELQKLMKDFVNGVNAVLKAK